MPSVVVAGTGFEVPPRVLTNADLEKMVDTSDQWITERTGMKERHIADPDVAASDLALGASRKALAEAGLQPADIDLIVVGTVTGDMPFPSTACVLQHKLGAAGAAVFDVSAGCTGSIYALSVANQYLRSGRYRNALVVGVEVLTRITDWTDRSTCVLFGDAAGAVVLKRVEEDGKGILADYLAADGSRGPDLYMPGGGSAIPATHESVDARQHYLRMKGNAIFKVAVRSMADATRRVCDAAGVKVEDLKLLIPHQANLRIIEAAGKLLGLPDEKVFVNIQKYGNTSSATTLIALDEARSAGLIQPGDLVAMVAFGAGLTWGGILFRF
jgi:3-oxoacyl-[acyl-carrier-protein] synthase-3